MGKAVEAALTALRAANTDDDKLLMAARHSCAKAIVKTPRAASLARLSERMWREGAYTKLSALRKMKKKDSTASSPSSSFSSSPQRLQAFLKAVRDDYRALSRELRLRLPSSALQRDAPRVDVGRMQVKGEGRRATVGGATAQRAVRVQLMCYHHTLLALGDVARYTAEVRGLAEDEARRQRKLAICYYEAAGRVVPKSGHPFNRLALCALSLRQPLDAAFNFCRALSVRSPVVTAREALAEFFQRDRTVEKAMAVARGLNQGPSLKEAEAQRRREEVLREKRGQTEGVQLPLRPKDAIGPPWVVITAGEKEMEELLKAAASETVSGLARDGRSPVAPLPTPRTKVSEAEVYAPNVALAKQGDLDKLALGYVALLYSRVTSVDLAILGRAFEAVLQRELARDAVDPGKCLKYTILLLWTVHHALAVRVEQGPAEECALAVKATMAVLRLLWLVGQAPLARTMVAFAALPSFAVLLSWVTCQPALTMTAAAASPSLYNMPPFPFAGLGELQDVVRKAIGILRDAAADVVPASLPVDASRTHAMDGSELGDAEEDSLAMFRRPAHSSDESGGEDEDQSEDESHSGGSSSGSDTVSAESGDEETRGPEEGAVDGRVTATGENDSLLERLREWLDVDGPRTPIQEDHLLRPLHWLPKQGHRLLATSRKRVGQCADAADARAVLWTWRALAAAADSATQEWLAANNAPATSKPGDVLVTPVENTRAEATEGVGLGAAPKAEAASASEETEFAEEDAALPTTDEVGELRRERERLNRALEHRQRRGRSGAKEQGDLALSVASLELPTVVIPAILVPDTNVFLNARHWVVLKGIIVGEWMQAGGGNPELAVAVPLIVLKELQGIAQGGEGREEAATALASDVLRVLETEFAKQHGRLYALTGHGDYLAGGGFAEMGVRTSGMSNDDVIVQAAEAHAKDRATCRTLAGVECRVQRVALISGDKNVLLKARSRAVPSCSGDAFMAWLIEGLERITTAAEGDEA